MPKPISSENAPVTVVLACGRELPRVYEFSETVNALRNRAEGMRRGFREVVATPRPARRRKIQLPDDYGELAIRATMGAVESCGGKLPTEEQADLLKNSLALAVSVGFPVMREGNRYVVSVESGSEAVVHEVNQSGTLNASAKLLQCNSGKFRNGHPSEDVAQISEVRADSPGLLDRVPLPIIFFALAVCYALLGRVLLELASEVMPKRTAALAVGISWLVGWIWLIGTLLGGPKGGGAMLRVWIAVNVGPLVALGPFFLLPHPITLGIGVTAAISLVSWCFADRQKH